MIPYWKEASTLILTAFNGAPVKSGWNYSLLTLKRSAKSSFMPSGIVFPGGTIHSSDSNEKWLNLFSDFVIKDNNSLRLNEVPPIIEQAKEQLPKLLSLKITAIRETFEETGILLCFQKSNKLAGSKNEWISYCSFENLNEWRSKVQTDPSEFFNMCKHYDCCPDVQNVHLWSNWLTPNTAMGSKRFDAAFFIACLREKVIAAADEIEIEKLHWIKPDKLMNLWRNKEIFLPPPQVYETARLLQFQDIHLLSEFAHCRSKQGCQRWMPNQGETLDGTLSILPGDDAYKITDFCTPTMPFKVKITTEEFRSQCKVLHRMETVDNSATKIVVKNYKPTNGHMLPIEFS